MREELKWLYCVSGHGDCAVSCRMCRYDHRTDRVRQNADDLLKMIEWQSPLDLPQDGEEVILLLDGYRRRHQEIHKHKSRGVYEGLPTDYHSRILGWKRLGSCELPEECDINEESN